MAGSDIRIFLITGIPGIGKTTLIKTVCESLSGFNIDLNGFYTEEIRDNKTHKRIGFDVVSLDNSTTQRNRAVLARVTTSDAPHHKGPFVGQYKVDLTQFESIAIPALKVKSSHSSPVLYVVDEIGKMELFSRSFESTLRNLLSSNPILLATIPVPKGRPLAFVEELKRMSTTKLYEVTKENRNDLNTLLLKDLQLSLKL